MNYHFTDKENHILNSNPKFKEIISSIENDYSISMRKMTHEFGNALTLVNSSLQIIESSHPEVRDFKYWTSTMGDVHYLIDLISELSFYNNSEKLSLKATNLTYLISSIIDSFKNINSSSNIFFNFTTDTQIPLLTADETKIKQVLINLIKNAYESLNSDIPNSFVNINLSYNNNSITIKITDNGCGMSNDQLNTIFMPMVSFKTNGTGLGLPISKKIIEAHNGTLSVSSKENQGSTFIITLPV